MSEPKTLSHNTADEQRQFAEFLKTETTRRKRLVSELGRRPDTARWVAPAHLMKAYKALQFFDRLALWLQVTHLQDRRPTVLNAIAGRDADHEVDVSQVDDTRVRLDPFPFDIDEFRFEMSGRQLWPQPASTDMVVTFDGAPHAEQDVVLIA